MTGSLTLLYCPFPTLESARVAAKHLIEQRLVACCNILPPGESHYLWDGSYQTAEEVILLAKTTPAMAVKAGKAIRARHPYECPAILTIAATANADFAAWVGASVKELKIPQSGD